MLLASPDFCPGRLAIMTLRFAALAAVALSLSCASARASDPSALVEDVRGKVAGIESMDYVASGRVLKLAAGDKLVLGYLRSCWRETITGGVVKIGDEQSEVTGGKVERARIECDGGRLRLSTDQAARSGTMVWRRADSPTSPQMTIYGTAPLIEIGAPGRLRIERVDRQDSAIEFDVASNQLLRGRIVDLARTPHRLESGGTYRATFGGRSLVFRVDPKAKADGVPAIGRLMRL
jgi:hypothetical protein